MPQTFAVKDGQRIAAPLARVWALSTSVDVVKLTLGFKPVEGITHGPVKADSLVLWKGWLFGLPQHHLTRITAFNPPHDDLPGDGDGKNAHLSAHFQDTQAAGRFARFQHDHYFTTTGNGDTLLYDEIRFSLPFGPAGALVAAGIMQPFIRRTLRSRFQLLSRLATTAEGDRYM